MNKIKIPFYKERAFGEKVSATFDFLSQNLRYIWRYLLYIIAPLGIVTGLFINWLYFFGIQSQQSSGDPDIVTAVLIGVFSLLLCIINFFGYSVLFGFIYSSMLAYKNRENGLEGITWDELKPYMKDNVKRMLLYFLGLIPLMLIIILALVFLFGIFGTFGFLGAFFVMVLAFLFFVAYQMVMPVYLNEDIGYFDALKRGLHLGWNTFGGVLILMIVFAIIGYAISLVLSIPWTICYIVKVVAISQQMVDGFASSPAFNVLSYVLSTFMGMGSIAASVPMIIAMNYQYANAAEQEDSFSVDEEIDNFEQI